MNSSQRKPGPGTDKRNGHQRRPLLRLMRLTFKALGPIMPSTMGRLAEQLWSKTRRTKERDWESRAVAQAAVAYIDVPRSRVATYVWGSGDPVVLAHGWNARAAHLGAFVEPLLQEDFRVIGFDAPGHGRSSGRGTNLLQITEVLAELVRQHGAPRAIIGHSFGGLCAVHALGQGLAVGRVVCIAAPSSLGWLMERYTRYLDLPKAVASALELRVQTRFGRERWKRLSSAADVACPPRPCLVVHDRDDRVVPWSQAKALADAWPGALFMSTQGLGHQRILRDPEVVRRVVGFVSET